MRTRVHTVAPASESRTQWGTLREATHTALWTVATIVRNTSFCNCVASIAILCFSQGNVLSFQPVREQSYTSFFGAELVMTQSFTSSMVVMTLAQVLRSQCIAANPDRPLPLWYCIVKLVRQTFIQQLATLGLMVLVVYLISLLSKTVRPLKLEFYLNCVCSHLFLCHADLTTRGIIRQEAARRRGQVEPAVQRQGDGSSGPRSSATTQQQQLSSSSQRKRSPWSRFWRHYFSTLPITMFAFLAGLYVHYVKSLDVGKTQLDVVLFTFASTLFKLSVQEFAKWGALKRRIRDVRIMCVIVGVPTVLIDTQIRLVVQRLQSTQSTIAGTVLMALIEIGMRVSKLGFVKLHLYRRGSAQPSFPTATSLPAVPSEVATVAAADLARWKRNIWKLYMAEVYADMAAEYIAIGCSTSILFIYRSHPKYLLGGTPAAATSAPSAVIQLTILGSQVGMELVVDFLTTTLEVSRGMDFRELRKHGSFILTLFLLLTLVNIQVFTAIYLIAS